MPSAVKCPGRIQHPADLGTVSLMKDHREPWPEFGDSSEAHTMELSLGRTGLHGPTIISFGFEVWGGSRSLLGLHMGAREIWAELASMF